MPETAFLTEPPVTTSHDPRDGTPVASIAATTPAELTEALARAATAAPLVAAAAPAARSTWLHAVADALTAHADQLVAVADRETALGEARLHGEVLRTASQLRFYAEVAVDGAWLGITLDSATDFSPALSRCAQPLGPVAVFGASNFPFAFGLLGNDTASALAAGCPVLAKAHPAHALTCRLLADLAATALAAAGAPAGAFAAVHGFEAGVDLVRAPAVRAAAFTGSQGGGLALWRIANEREEVIPVFAEMGTVNPAVVTRGAGRHLTSIAAGFVRSYTLGSGQFCTKPGLLLAPAGIGAARAVADALGQEDARPLMLTESIARAVNAGLDELVAAGATPVLRLEQSSAGWSAPAALLSAPASALTRGSRLLDECFGPVALVAEYASTDELHRVLDELQGCLAAAVFAVDDDPDAADLLARLGRRAGRVTLNDWPTGVAWTWGQQHGGPWPATTRPESTSVGAAALDRFVRPVAFQSAPAARLPSPYREYFSEANPWALPRRVDGVREPV